MLRPKQPMKVPSCLNFPNHDLWDCSESKWRSAALYLKRQHPEKVFGLLCESMWCVEANALVALNSVIGSRQPLFDDNSTTFQPLISDCIKHFLWLTERPPLTWSSSSHTNGEHHSTMCDKMMKFGRIGVVTCIIVEGCHEAVSRESRIPGGLTPLKGLPALGFVGANLKTIIRPSSGVKAVHSLGCWAHV